MFETYPVLAMIALGWTLPDSRPAGRLPKYNPARKRTFSNSDWRHVCGRASNSFRERGLAGVVRWLDDAAQSTAPRKTDQHGLDAYICLLAAVYLAELRECLMVGDQETGYIVVPYGEDEWSRMEPLLRGGLSAIKDYRAEHGTSIASTPIVRLYGAALDEFERIAGCRKPRHDALWHHRRSMHDAPCLSCGKPLRTPDARSCGACGARSETV